jgi:hypothetical protein
MASIQFDPTLLSVTTEIIPITDANLAPVWGNHLTRLLFHAARPGAQGEWTIQIGA